MVSILLISCGGAGKRFIEEVRKAGPFKTLTINDSLADINVSESAAKLADSLVDKQAFELFPWLEKIEYEYIVVIAGLGGLMGSSMAVIIGKALHRRAKIYGMFSEPFKNEGKSRVKTTIWAKKEIEKTYRGAFYLSNEEIFNYYPNLKIGDAMRIHPVVMKHLLRDMYLAVIPRRPSWLEGNMGAGVGFGVGRERIRLAIEDAVDSPWLTPGEKYAVVSGDIDKEDVEPVIKHYDFEDWIFYHTQEHGSEIKVTVISK